MTEKKKRDKVTKGPITVSFTPRSILCLLNFATIEDNERRRLQRRFERFKFVTPAERKSWDKYIASDKSLKNPS